MVTKGIIQTLDLLGNTCTVRMPLFETSGNDEITGTATISNTPGSYNGYRVGDVVWIAFEDGQMNTPVVIGKLYLGAEAERNDPRGIINVESSTITKNATMPADTKLTAQIDNNVPNTTVPYSSLSSIANNLNTLNVNVAQNDRDYGNRFKQVISNADDLKTSLEQTASNMVAKASGFKQNANGEFILDDKGNKIPEEFGWELQSNKWTVFSQEGEILKADQYGLTIKGEIKAESGHIGSFEIGKTHDCPIIDANGNPTSETIVASGIYSNNYIKTFEEDTIGKEGVYIGTDGIKLGANFSVDTNGEVIAKSLKIGNTDNPETADLGVEITNDGKVKMTNLVTDQLAVYTKDDESTPNENEAKPILLVNVDEDGKPSEGNVQIGSFKVDDSSLSCNYTAKNIVTEEDEEHFIRVGKDGIALGASTDEENNTIPFMVSTTGEIFASKGTFSGEITATEAHIEGIKTLTMAEESTAIFDTLTATKSITATGQINSHTGYFFGSGNECGFSISGDENTDYSDSITLTISAGFRNGISNDTYSIIIKSDKPVAEDTTIEFSKAEWTNNISLPDGSLTILAGGTTASKRKTIASRRRFNRIQNNIQQVTQYASDTNLNYIPELGTVPKIKSITFGKKIIENLNVTTHNFEQKKTVSNNNNIKLLCNTFEMNGKITVPSGGAFQVTDDTNKEVVTLNKNGLTLKSSGTIVADGTITSNGDIVSKGNLFIRNSSDTKNVATLNSTGLAVDGTVKFKINGTEYEPVVRLPTSLDFKQDDGTYRTENGVKSPNCFWAIEVADVAAGSWKSIQLPKVLEGKVIAASITAVLGKNKSLHGNKDDNTEKIVSTANCWFVDYTTDKTKIWVGNGQVSAGTGCLLIAAKI